MDLSFPDTPEVKTYKDICGTLKKHFTPAVSVYAERKKFYDAHQQSNESVAEFVARLKGLTRYCKFGACFKDVLRDKYVCGVSQEAVFNKLSGNSRFRNVCRSCNQEGAGSQRYTFDDNVMLRGQQKQPMQGVWRHKPPIAVMQIRKLHLSRLQGQRALGKGLQQEGSTAKEKGTFTELRDDNAAR